MNHEANVLCTECGICCDGTLYGGVALGIAANAVGDAEITRLQRRGLRVVVTEDGTPEMLQPCAALRGCLCAVYEERPAACAAYACQLRDDVERGDRPLEAARSTVREARLLVENIRTGLRLPDGVSIWQGIAALERPPSAEAEEAWAKEHADSLRAVSSLIALLRATFEAQFAGATSRRA